MPSCIVASCHRGCDRCAVAVAGPASAEPLRLHPQNPHYFLFRGKPTVLVTSGEHYGAVVNLDFKYDVYLDALAADGLNLTRLFVGSYLEKPGDFGIRFNTLAPAPGRAITPWARSTDRWLCRRRPEVRSRSLGRRLLRPPQGLRRQGRRPGHRRRGRAVLELVRQGHHEPASPGQQRQRPRRRSPPTPCTRSPTARCSRGRKRWCASSSPSSTRSTTSTSRSRTSPTPPVRTRVRSRRSRDPKAPARVKVATAASLAWQARVAGWIA